MSERLCGPKRFVIEDLHFAYSDWNVHFKMDVPAGSIIAIIGPSGAGKSTLLNLVAGFEAPESGTIRFAGDDVTLLEPADRPITMLFQENNLFAHLDVETNVALGISPAMKLSEAQKVQVQDALVRVGLEGFAKRLPGQLSGGERQRVAIARAVVRAKPLLLLDEPFAALGPALKSDMLDLICDIQRETGMTVLFVTHHPDDARRAADYTAFVAAGKIIVLQPTTDLFARRDIPELSAYLGT